MNSSRSALTSPTWRAQRLQGLPPYLFVEIDRKNREARAAGRDIIDMGVGDPDQPTFPFLVDAMREAVRRPAHHRYPSGAGSEEFRVAASGFLDRMFHVKQDPGRQILALLGSKEGLAHLPLAVLNPGDVALIPDPAYPVYQAGVMYAGAECHTMALKEQAGWLPDLSAIPTAVRRKARMMFLNYPNNPTGAWATRSFFEEVVAFAKEYGILVVHDAAYAGLYFDEPPPSVLQVAGAEDVCVEMHSLSKTFNMTGWRIGFAAGNAEALAALAAVKNTIDSGPFGAVQEAACAAMDASGSEEVANQRRIYQRRRDVLVDGLRRCGWSAARPKATFFVWAKSPNRTDSMSTVLSLLDAASVVSVPGSGFGACGEGYVRFALTVEEDRIAEAVDRISRL